MEVVAMTRAALLLAVAGSIAVRSGAAQLPTSPGQVSAPPSFEVASIRPNTSGSPSQSSRTGEGSLTTTNMRVRALIVLAYGIRPDRIVGAPSWIDQERFDIAARAAANTSDNQLRLMLRTLLAERLDQI
jgi:hypothetical protein